MKSPGFVCPGYSVYFRTNPPQNTVKYVSKYSSNYKTLDCSTTICCQAMFSVEKK